MPAATRRHAAGRLWVGLLGIGLAGIAVAGSGLAFSAAAEPVLTLKFSDFHRRPVGPRGLELSPQLWAANGRLVRIVGYMVANEQPQPGRLLLTPRPLSMSEHADGDADDLPPSTVLVLLPPAQATELVAHQDGLIEFTGTLSVGRFEGGDGRVSWVQLQLPDGAVQSSVTPNVVHRTDPITRP